MRSLAFRDRPALSAASLISAGSWSSFLARRTVFSLVPVPRAASLLPPFGRPRPFFSARAELLATSFSTPKTTLSHSSTCRSRSSGVSSERCKFSAISHRRSSSSSPSTKTASMSSRPSFRTAASRCAPVMRTVSSPFTPRKRIGLICPILLIDSAISSTFWALRLRSRAGTVTSSGSCFSVLPIFMTFQIALVQRALTSEPYPRKSILRLPYTAAAVRTKTERHNKHAATAGVAMEMLGEGVIARPFFEP